MLGLKIEDMVEVYRFGLMGLFMKVIGETIRLIWKEGFYMLMVIITKEIGYMIKLMGMVFIITKMEDTLEDIGKKINNMEKVVSRGGRIFSLN